MVHSFVVEGVTVEQPMDKIERWFRWVRAVFD